jgi:Condensation domain
MHPARKASQLDPAGAPGVLGEPQFRFPTTLAQQALWYLDRLEPGNPAWNIAVRFRVCGALDTGILHRAINEIVRRHDILRTTFSFMDGLPAQVIHLTAHIPLPMDDLSALSPDERGTEEERRTIAEGQQSFDLQSGPLVRARLLRLAEQEHMLIVTMHHIVSDGWSIGIFSDEISVHYQAFVAGRASRAPELPFQYADYAVWKLEHCREFGVEGSRSYWVNKLAALPTCEIPTDRERPPVKTHNGYILSVLLPVPLSDELTNFSHQQGCTLFITALAALKMLIAHHTEQSDIYVGTLLAGRDRVEIEPLIGVFINTIVLRTDLSGNPTFLQLLARVKQTVEEGVAHQDLHIQQVVEALRPKRDLSRPTLYGINFIYQRDFVKPVQFSGLTMAPVPSKSPGAIYDLNFFMVQRSDGWRLSCEYNTDLYNAPTVSRLLGQLKNVLAEIARNPNRKLSEFSYPEDAGEPLPSFVPQSIPARSNGNRTYLSHLLRRK